MKICVPRYLEGQEILREYKFWRFLRAVEGASHRDSCQFFLAFRK